MLAMTSNRINESKHTPSLEICKYLGLSHHQKKKKKKEANYERKNDQLTIDSDRQVVSDFKTETCGGVSSQRRWPI